MASEFIPLNEIDTKELRKKLGLPITKKLKYFHKENERWYENDIVDYTSVEVYQSGSHGLMIELDNGKKICIHSDYLAEMQKSSLMDILEEKSTVSELFDSKSNTMGKRIEATPETYIVVDLETTGTNHYADEIIEIGAIKYVKGTEAERFSMLIKSKKPVSKKIEMLTGISNEMLEAEGVDKAVAVKSLYTFLGKDIIIGHNIAAFDSKFMEDAFQVVLNCHFSNDYVDTLFMAREVLPDLEHHRLEDLAKEYNIDYSKAHRAVEDCIINHFVYEYMAFNKILNENISSEYLLKTVDSTKNEEVINEENLVLINKSEFAGWKEHLMNALNSMIIEKNLPANSLCLMANVGRQNNMITSYSVCIYEPDLIEDKRNVERNSIVTRIVEGKLKSNPDILTIEPKNQDELKKIPIPGDATIYTPEKALAYIRIDQSSDSLVPYLISSVNYALENYSPKTSSFACCARYEKCSDAKKCIHENQLYSKACEYRKNLEAGKIFYGKNKNV